jgi:uncharacterized protein
MHVFSSDEFVFPASPQESPFEYYTINNDQKIDALRAAIPSFRCIKGCHDCCGPVTVAAEEMARIPVKSMAIRDAALAHLSCPHLGAEGCEIYAERPLICRLFGTTPSLLCPNGQRPEYMIESAVEHKIHAFLGATRQVLL